MSNTIPYLEIKDFLDKYPIENSNTLSSTNARIHYGEDYVVKEYYQHNRLSELVKELNVYNIAEHQCIVKPLAWSAENNIGYLAMPRGKDIKEAYEDGDITMRRIIFDTLSAVTYLNEATIVHGDIKHHNMLYYKEDNRCKLIDMGLCKFAILNTDGQYYTSGVAYTLGFRKPNYVSARWNNINCEIYALFSSYMFIETECKNTSEDFCSFYNYTPKDKDLAWLFSLPMISVRDLLNQVSKRFALPLYEECKSVLNYAKLPFNSSPAISNLLSTMFRMHGSLDPRSLLLAFQIVSRTYREIIKNHSGKHHMTVAYGAACVELAVIINKGFEENNIGYWCGEFEIDYSTLSQLYNEIVVDIIKITGGIIYSFTYWNYARCIEDINPIVNALIENKPVYVSKYIGDRNKNIEQEYVTCYTPRGNEQLLELIEQPCELDIKPETYLLEFSNLRSTEDLLALLLYNKNSLTELETETACSIYTTLVNTKDFVNGRNYVLDKICHFDWKKNPILEKGLHPFRKLS